MCHRSRKSIVRARARERRVSEFADVATASNFCIYRDAIIAVVGKPNPPPDPRRVHAARAIKRALEAIGSAEAGDSPRRRYGRDTDPAPPAGNNCLIDINKTSRIATAVSSREPHKRPSVACACAMRRAHLLAPSRVEEIVYRINAAREGFCISSHVSAIVIIHRSVNTFDRIIDYRYRDTWNGRIKNVGL